MQTAPECVDPVFHVRQAGTSGNSAQVESATVIDDVDMKLPTVLMQAQRDC